MLLPSVHQGGNLTAAGQHHGAIMVRAAQVIQSSHPISFSFPRSTFVDRVLLISLALIEFLTSSAQYWFNDIFPF
jgi:hypothetical protein